MRFLIVLGRPIQSLNRLRRAMCSSRCCFGYVGTPRMHTCNRLRPLSRCSSYIRASFVASQPAASARQRSKVLYIVAGIARFQFVRRTANRCVRSHAESLLTRRVMKIGKISGFDAIPENAGKADSEPESASTVDGSSFCSFGCRGKPRMHTRNRLRPLSR